MNEEVLKNIVPLTPAILQVLSTSPEITTQIQAWELLGVLASDRKVSHGLRNFVRARDSIDMT
jgi:hypothetical protein